LSVNSQDDDASVCLTTSLTPRLSGMGPCAWDWRGDSTAVLRDRTDGRPL